MLTLLSTGCADADAPVSSPPQAVQVASVRVGPLASGHQHLAEVVPAQTVRVLAQVPGRVTWLAEEGDRVEVEDPVARIAAPDLAARAARAAAERARAEQERDFACAQQEVDRALAATGDVPTLQRDRSETTCAAAEHAVHAARAAERDAGVGLSRRVERAPHDGVVLARLVDPGQTVHPGTPLLEVGTTARWLRLRIAAPDLAEVRVGTRVETAGGPGRVVAIGARGTGPARLVDVEAVLDGPLDARVGTTLTATLVHEAWSEAVAVPPDALGEDDAGRFVLVIEGDRVRRHAVTLGPRTRGWVAIEPPLPPEARVVVSAPGQVDPARPVLAVPR